MVGIYSVTANVNVTGGGSTTTLGDKIEEGNTKATGISTFSNRFFVETTEMKNLVLI